MMPEALDDKKITPTVVITKNSGLKNWSNTWTVRQRLKQLLPGVEYEARPLRRSCEWEFTVSSDTTEFLAALTDMKLEGTIQENVVDIHVRNLPWSWEMEHIQELLLETYPSISSVVVFSRKDSQPKWAYHRGFDGRLEDRK